MVKFKCLEDDIMLFKTEIFQPVDSLKAAFAFLRNSLKD